MLPAVAGLVRVLVQEAPERVLVQEASELAAAVPELVPVVLVQEPVRVLVPVVQGPVRVLVREVQGPKQQVKVLVPVADRSLVPVQKVTPVPFPVPFRLEAR